MAEPWFTIDAAANRVGRSRRTIRRWIEAGKLDEVLGRVRESQLLAAEKSMRDRMHKGRPRRGAPEEP